MECKTGRGVGDARLVSDQGRANGLAAAFLACGAAGYAGYFWPVTDDGACGFTETFYPALFGLENVGLVFQEARKRTVRSLAQAGDLSGFSAVLFGDAASGKRRDLAKAAYYVQTHRSDRRPSGPAEFFVSSQSCHALLTYRLALNCKGSPAMDLTGSHIT